MLINEYTEIDFGGFPSHVTEEYREQRAWF